MNVGIRVEGRIDENVPRPVKNGLVFISVRPKQYNQIDWRPKSIPSNRSDYDMFPLYTDCQSLSEEGTFKFENLPPGILDVIVLGDGFVWKNQSTNETGNVPQSFDLQRPTTQVVIATEPSKTVELVVRDQRGKPAAGIPIDFEIWAKFIGSIQQQPSVIYTYSQPNQKYYLEKYRLTDKEGRVVFNNLPTFVHGFYQFQDGASPKYLVTPSPDPLKTGVTNNFKVRLYE
jgi:hypothetical protein